MLLLIFLRELDGQKSPYWNCIKAKQGYKVLKQRKQKGREANLLLIHI